MSEKMTETTKAAWHAPKLETLDVAQTLTGPIPLDQEATLGGFDTGTGGPQTS